MFYVLSGLVFLFLQKGGRMKSKHLIILVISAFVLASCASYVKPVEEDICTKCEGLIKDGKTTKSEVLQREDFYIFFKTYKSNNNTILIFKISDGKKWWDTRPKIYNLVLVFDQDDILQKHSLVQVQ
jgi:hypothetical protein